MRKRAGPILNCLEEGFEFVDFFNIQLTKIRTRDGFCLISSSSLLLLLVGEIGLVL